MGTDLRPELNFDARVSLATAMKATATMKPSVATFVGSEPLQKPSGVVNGVQLTVALTAKSVAFGQRTVRSVTTGLRVLDIVAIVEGYPRSASLSWLWCCSASY